MTHGGSYQPRTVFAGSVSVQFAAAHCAEQAAALAKVSAITSTPVSISDFCFFPFNIFLGHQLQVQNRVEKHEHRASG